MSVDSQNQADWRMQLFALLGAPDAKRVCLTPDLQALVKRVRPTAHPETVRLAIDGLVLAGALRKVSRGTFLNQRCTPPAELEEVVPLIRAGAHVSLQSVLGKTGVLNNIPDRTVAFAVVSTTGETRPNLGRVDLQEGGYIHVRGLPGVYFPQDDAQRRLMLVNGARVPTFRPEAALLQWLHLAGNKRSDLEPPPIDLDQSLLDPELLDALAAHWQLKGELAAWQVQARAKSHGEESTARVAAPTEERQDAAAAARARLMARGNRPR